MNEKKNREIKISLRLSGMPTNSLKFFNKILWTFKIKVFFQHFLKQTSAVQKAKHPFDYSLWGTWNDFRNLSIILMIFSRPRTIQRNFQEPSELLSSSEYFQEMRSTSHIFESLSNDWRIFHRFKNSCDSNRSADFANYQQFFHNVSELYRMAAYFPEVWRAWQTIQYECNVQTKKNR